MCAYIHCIITHTDDDNVTSNLHKLLQPFLLRRVKSEVRSFGCVVHTYVCTYIGIRTSEHVTHTHTHTYARTHKPTCVCKCTFIHSYIYQVLLDLPERSEVTLYTGMTSLQKKLYKSILMKDTSEYRSTVQAMHAH